MSDEAKKIIKRILIEVGGCKYLYKSTVIGAIDACISIYGMKPPSESNEIICDRIFCILNNR